MKKQHIAVLFSICLSTLSCAKENWSGNYFCELELGDTAAEQSIIIEHELSISEGSCKLAVNGFQVSEDITCNATQLDSGVSIAFSSYADGSLKNIYDVQVYKPGEVLFELTQSPEKPLTRWKALHASETAGKDKNCFALETEK